MIGQHILSLVLVAGTWTTAGDEQQAPPIDPASAGAPDIGSLRVDLHGNGRATVRWVTDRPATTRLDYGEVGGPLDQSLSRAGLRRRHQVSLSGLSQGREYAFRAASGERGGTVRRSERRRFHSGFAASVDPGVELAGVLRPWHPVTLSFQGPQAHELDDAPNPFLDYRLNLELLGPSGTRLTVPGYFAGDGDGGGFGGVWRARFAPSEPGRWSWVARFVSGPEVAIDETGTSGTPTAFDGLTGFFDVAPRDPAAPGFYRWGKLRYVGEHYLRFADGPYFLKSGSNSPENFLGYAGFDNTVDQGGLNTSGLVDGLHRFEPHRADWGRAGLGSEQDPLFASEDTGYDSRGIVGALNYLSAAGVNGLFVMPMNLGGDGWETCPFVSYADDRTSKTHYDVSKLHQWDQVLEHAQRRGIMLQMVLNETEVVNETWLDDGKLGVERKLYYRELVARFGHLPAIKWNISEECHFSTADVRAFAGYIGALDPYDHPIGFHVDVLPLDGSSAQWNAFLGDPTITTNSIQAIPFTASTVVEKWRADSHAAGLPWVVDFDEQILALTNLNAEELRKRMLYDVIFSGGNIEWYAGYQPLPLGGDLRVEDFRTREEMWRYSLHARRFVEENLPFHLMEPADQLVSGENTTEGGAEVFALPGRHYAVYYPSAANTGTLDLGLGATALGATTAGVYEARWYNPRSGLFEGTPRAVRVRDGLRPGDPPSTPGEDWVYWLRSVGVTR